MSDYKCDNLVYCHTYGCRGTCKNEQKQYGAPILPTDTPTPKGCICPPTAEQTCQRDDCGRKPPPPRTGDK